MKQESTITVDDLPRYSPWPARLLGLEPWSLHEKTRAEILREYEKEKWGPLLARFRAARAEGQSPTVADVDEWLSPSSATPLPVSVDETIVLMSRVDSRRRYLELLETTLARYAPAEVLVELGVGFGGALLNLVARPSLRATRAIGLDLCPSGVALLGELAAAHALPVEHGICDLGSATVTEHPIPRGALLYTSFATSCVPVLEPAFVDRLSSLAPRAVVHFEPFYEHAGDSLLGLLRRRYTELNGYNRTYLDVLKQRAAEGRIEILEERPNRFGVNPLFAASVVVWRPRG